MSKQIDYNYFNSLSEESKLAYVHGFDHGVTFMEYVREAPPEELLAWFENVQKHGIPVPQKSIDNLRAWCESRKNKSKRSWFSIMWSKIV